MAWLNGLATVVVITPFIFLPFYPNFHPFPPNSLLLLCYILSSYLVHIHVLLHIVIQPNKDYQHGRVRSSRS